MLLEKAKTILDSSNIPKTNKEFWGQILVQSPDETVLKFIHLFENDNKTLALATKFLYARLFCNEELNENTISSDEIKLILYAILKKKGLAPLDKNIGKVKPISTDKMIKILQKNPFFEDMVTILPFIDSISISQVNN